MIADKLPWKWRLFDFADILKFLIIVKGLISLKNLIARNYIGAINVFKSTFKTPI